MLYIRVWVNPNGWIKVDFEKIVDFQRNDWATATIKISIIFSPKKVYWNTYYTQRKCAAIPIFEPRLLHRALIPCVDDTNVLIHAAVKDTLIKSEILQKICSFLQKKAELNGRTEGIVMQSNYYNAQLIYEFIQPIWKYIRQNSEM